MAWFPCGNCCCIQRVLYWGAPPPALIDAYDNIDVQVDTELGSATLEAWTGNLDDYVLVYVEDVSSDPVWWGRITGNDWHGRVVLQNSTPAANTWVDSKSGLTGMDTFPTSGDGGTLCTSRPAVAHDLTAGVTTINSDTPRGVTGGQPLAKNFFNVVWMAWNRPAGSRADFVVAGDKLWSGQCASGNAQLFHNLYNFGLPPCGTTPMVLPLDAPPIQFGFSSAALTGAAAASASVQGPTFDASGRLSDASAGQISGLSSVAFTTAGAMQAEGAMSGAAAVTFTTSAAGEATASLLGSSSFAFTASGLLTGTGKLTGSSQITFTATAQIGLSAEVDIEFTVGGQLGGAIGATGGTSFAFSTAGALRGTANATGASFVTFSHVAVLKGSGSLVGLPTFAFTAMATPTGILGFSGLIPITFTAAGNLKGAGKLSGSTAITFGEVAVLNGSGKLSGGTSFGFTTAGRVTGAAQRTGVAQITFADVAVLSGSGKLTGAANVAFADVAVLKGTGKLTGTSNVTFASVAVLTATGPLSGTANVAFAEVGVLTGTGPLRGTSNVAFSYVAVLGGVLPLTGFSTFHIVPVGQLGGVKVISGSTSITVGHVAVLKGSGKLTGATFITTTTAGQLRGSGKLTGATSIQFTPSGTITGTEDECETPCENCGSESTPATITLRLANGCICGNCGSNTPDTYTVSFGNDIDPGDFNCLSCSDFLGGYVLDRVSSGSESGTCKWEYTGTVCGRTYVLRLEITDIFVSLEWLDGARVEARWQWEHGGASPNCSGQNIRNFLEFMPGDDGEGDCTWFDVHITGLSSSGSCTVQNDGCGSCSSLLGDYILEQNLGDPTSCQYIGLFTTACGEMSLSITFNSNGISGGIGIAGVPQAGMQLTQTAPYNCALTASFGRMSITSTQCNFENVVASIIGTTPCT